MYYLIVNEHGGGGRAKIVCTKVEKILKENKKDFKLFCTQKEHSATDIAYSLTAGSYKSDSLEAKDIIVIGGDGTINEVLCGIQDFSKVRLGIIPTGSGNDFSRGLGISRKTKEAVKKLLSATSGTFIDLGCVQNNITGDKHFFGISAGIGLDAVVCQKVDSSFLKNFLNRFKLGKFVYSILTVVSFFTMRKTDVSIKFDNEEQEVTYKDLIFLAAMNMKTEGGGIPMAPDATPTDGKLSVCIAYGYSKIKSFITFASLTKGKHTKLKGFYLRDFNSLCVTAKEDIVLHTDGECCKKVLSIKIDCLPSKLCILI